MLPESSTRRVGTHWGTYEVRGYGKTLAFSPVANDPRPCGFWEGIEQEVDGRCRILSPMVRASFLERGYRAGGEGRGREAFVAVGWDKALDLVAGELGRVKQDHGNAAIYGGSYGWSSAGRFHHAQSQTHRFLNTLGGYTASVNSYSYGAAEVILPHVIGTLDGLDNAHSSWLSIEQNCQLVVAFGGMPSKNTQANAGGLSRHVFAEHLMRSAKAGVEFVSVSPIRDDLQLPGSAWLPIRPTTDTALMLGLAHVLHTEGLCDRVFLARYTVGYDRFAAYLTGETDGEAKSPAWAARICGIGKDEIAALARRMARSHTLLSMSWSVQRAEHGEQPYWMLITLAAMLGQIGLPGCGFGFGYGTVNGIGHYLAPFTWPSLPQGMNNVEEFIPVSRIADALLAPGESYRYNGTTRRYPHLRLIYWAGGNPFHHHQDLNRLVEAWKRPETIIVHEAWWTAAARRADIVLPCTLPLERDDLVCTKRDRVLLASNRVQAPAGEARDDFAIFRSLAERLGCGDDFTDRCDEEAWLRRLYAQARQRALAADIALPDFDAFWRAGWHELPERPDMPPLMADFRQDPGAHRLPTPSGRIEIFSQTIADFALPSSPGHPVWNPPVEWLGAPLAREFPLHLMSNQPSTRLHSQNDHLQVSRNGKIDGREPIRIHPLDATRRGIEDGMAVRVHNRRGAFLSVARLDAGLMPGILQIATGAWYDPEEPGVAGTLDKHGNPNVVTSDRGTSELAQASTANSCLVEVEPFAGVLPEITCYGPPATIGGDHAVDRAPVARHSV